MQFAAYDKLRGGQKQFRLGEIAPRKPIGMKARELGSQARFLLHHLLKTHQRALYGAPERFATSSLRRALDRLRWGPLGEYIWLSRRIRGWMRRREAVELARTTYFLPEDAIVVEIGSFLVCSTVLLAGGRKLQNSGKVHCVDCFDAVGDSFSVPIYRQIAGSLDHSIREHFDENILKADLADWVEVHQGNANEVVPEWTTSIDLLFMDGDHSDRGAQETYERWSVFLKIGGIIAVHNSAPGSYAPDHGGSRRLVEHAVCPPQYSEIRCVGSTTFARKMKG